ncbi:MAG: alpha/beta fold hydrolase [Chloroflexi bacterium]|nr:alpha/beta fold hydrolase [Chloroflexota bacterium]
MPHLDLGDGFRLYYEVHGPAIDAPGAATPVLLAHGAGGNAMSWWNQVPALADRYPVITFDHRGFARSHDIPDGPGRIAFGPDTLALLDHLQVPRVHFVAHSMGGRTAFAVYNREPDRIASFTYSGTNGGAVDDRYRALRAQLEADGTLAGTLLSRALAPAFVEEQPELHFLYRRIRALNPPRPADFLQPGGRLVNFRGTAATRLAASGRPILWLVGDLDRVVHPDLIAISHDLTPGSRFHVIPGSGHSGYIERPAHWNATVRAFLDEVEDGRWTSRAD